MDGFHHPATNGSPLPKLPWNTYVHVTNPRNNKTLSVPLIDLGPSLRASSHAAIDLTEAAFKQLGGKPSAGILPVTYSIPGAARFLPADLRARDTHGLRTVSLTRSLAGARVPTEAVEAHDEHRISHGLMPATYAAHHPDRRADQAVH